MRKSVAPLSLIVKYMKETDYIALAALLISIISMWFSFKANRRSIRIGKEEKRRTLLVDLLSLQPRLLQFIPLAKSYVGAATNTNDSPHTPESCIRMNETISILEDAAKEVTNYLTGIKKVDRLNENELEQALTWVTLNNKVLDELMERLSSSNRNFEITNSVHEE